MSATNKSAKLGLCLWKATDKPSRQDFVADNNVLESVVGGHVNNTSLHLTAAEKERLQAPYTSLSYTGNGSASRVIPVPANLTWGMIFCLDKPLNLTEDGVTHYYTDAWMLISGENWSRGGMSLSGRNLTVRSGAGEENGAVYHLNDQGLRYIGIFFPKLS